MVKVKNVANSVVIVPNGRGGDIIILPGEEKEIDEKYLNVFSGKLVKVQEEAKEEVKGEGNKKQGGRRK